MFRRRGDSRGGGVGDRVPAVPEGFAHRHRARPSVAGGGGPAVVAGASTGHRVAQVCCLGGGDDVAGIDANAQGFVAAVFGHDTVAELTGQQQREPVPGLGATDAIAPPRDDW